MYWFPFLAARSAAPLTDVRGQNPTVRTSPMTVNESPTTASLLKGFHPRRHGLEMGTLGVEVSCGIDAEGRQ